jgi:putative tricarboxylic transport membrane protein
LPLHRRFLSRDAIAGLAVLAASLFLFWLTLGLERNPLVPIGPAFYPRIVLGVTALLAALLVVRGLLQKKSATEGREKSGYIPVAVQFGVFALYVVALPLLGFRIATFAYTAAASLLLEPPRRPAHWVRALVLGVATAIASYYAFEGYLQVLLPRGRWTDF